MSEVLLVSAAGAAGSFFILWLVSLTVKDASIVDPFWGPGFVIIAWTGYAVAPDPGGRGFLVSVSSRMVGNKSGTAACWLWIAPAGIGNRL